MRKKSLIVPLLVMAFACSSARAQIPDAPQSGTPKPADASATQPPASASQIESPADAAKRAAYPKDWDVQVTKNTRLDELRQKLDKQISTLPAADLEDQSPLPIWFRVYLRKQYPDLTTSGPYQYPRTANRILRRMLDNPNDVSLDVK